MKITRTSRWLTLALLSAVLCAPGLRAEEEGSSIDPKVTEVVNAWAAHLEGLDRYQQTLRTVMKVEAEGMKNEMTATYTLAVEKPNKFALVLQQGFNGVTVVSDGETLHTFMAMMKRYTEEDAPETMEDLAMNPAIAMTSMGAFGPSQIYLTEDPAESLMEGVTRAEYVGEEEKDGVKTHHLKFFQDEFDWESWFSAEGVPLILEVKPDFAKALEAHGGGMPGSMAGMKMEVSMQFSDWKEEVDADLFTFVPPEGATKADSLFEGFDQAGGGGKESDLVGTEAPAIKLNLLDEGELDLDAHRGKDVVVLDFWATWCPPCVRGLPKVAEVVSEFQDNGVVFYAVNQREKPEAIKKFLAKKDLDVVVALDPKGEAGKSYEVSGIPQTVVIDKEGMIVDVHVGFSPGIEESLRETLDELVGAED